MSWLLPKKYCLYSHGDFYFGAVICSDMKRVSRSPIPEPEKAESPHKAGFPWIKRCALRVSASAADCMAVEAVSPGIVSKNFPDHGNFTGMFILRHLPAVSEGLTRNLASRLTTTVGIGLQVRARD